MRTMRTLGYYFLLVGILSCGLVTGVNAAAIQSISVQSITYGVNTLQKDDGSGAYPSPHWSANNSSPVAYPCTTFISCSITLSFNPPDSSGYFSFNGLASDGTAFQTILQQFKDPNVSTYTIAAIYSDNLPQNVHKISSVVWKYNLNGLAQPNTEAGTSTSPIYVVLRNPIAGTKMFHTVLEHACVPAGATNDGEAITNSWSKFNGPANTKNHAGQDLYYYQANVSFANNTNTTVDGLLKDKNGRCNAWSDLWLHVLKANGINPALKTVACKGASGGWPNDQGFLIRNWSKDNQGGSGHPTYKWAITSTGAGQATYFEMVPLGTGDFGDLTSTTGIAGQNTATPSEKVFEVHIIVQVGSSTHPYFDPSYGVRYTNADDIETKSVYGFYGFRSNPPNATKILMRDKAGNGIQVF